MKNTRYIGILFGLLALQLLFLVEKEAKGENALQESLASKVIRLHVVANSDGEADQALKLKVKDEVVKGLRKDLETTLDKESAERVIRSRLKSLEAAANAVIAREGYPYIAKASLGNTWFPIKQYGDLTFPQGEYEALRIEIGRASGKNWWCVMFPTLCVVDESYQVVPEPSKEMLKQELTYEEYSEICRQSGGSVEYRSRLGEWWNDVWTKQQ